ncbi:hypothetical protein ACKUB1_10655 [Methanospirillum stamsii]|uniref:hypothetical protein n=1 Tax=Methanospirillum stamsii TaxID=1277351 RepID=UPI0015E838F4|nr:hypothetical protein [Methanospirillum stamsii]
MHSHSPGEEDLPRNHHCIQLLVAILLKKYPDISPSLQWYGKKRGVIRELFSVWYMSDRMLLPVVPYNLIMLTYMGYSP